MNGPEALLEKGRTQEKSARRMKSKTVGPRESPSSENHKNQHGIGVGKNLGKMSEKSPATSDKMIQDIKERYEKSNKNSLEKLELIERCFRFLVDENETK